MDRVDTDQGAQDRPGGVLRAHLRASVPARVVLPPPAPPSLQRAAATAAARAASRAQGLQVSGDSITAGVVTLAELPEVLPEGALLALVEGGGERLGVVALCPAMLASLIEMQAVGRVSARPAGTRRPTRTDAAMAAGFINLLLGELAGGLQALPQGEALGGLRYASYLDDPRPLGLMLEDGSFHSLTLRLRLGAGGERTGTIFIAVPGPAPVEARPAAASPALPPMAPPAERRTLAAAVRHAPVPLQAVLCRKSLTLRELRALTPGAVLALPRGALEEVQVETGAGQVVASGRLGEADGFFAVRLSGGSAQPPVPVVSTGEPPMADLDGPDIFRSTADGFAVLPLTAGAA